MGRYGDRFGLLIFDEVHHLPAPGYLTAAENSMAPFRLGLTATWEREDGAEEELWDLLGPWSIAKKFQPAAVWRNMKPSI